MLIFVATKALSRIRKGIFLPKLRFEDISKKNKLTGFF
jgi:hypothetical protein